MAAGFPKRGLAAWDGGVAPLFDRLVDADPRAPAEPRPHRSLRVEGVEGLRRSVERELERLLNTRRPVAYGASERPRSVLDYGIPDASALPPRSGDDVALLAAAIASAIERFEPRLGRVSVAIDHAGPPGDVLTARISGELRLRRVSHRVSFSVPLSPADTGAE